MSSLKTAIEALLFITEKPIHIKNIVKWTAHSQEDVQSALDEMILEYKGRGILLVGYQDEYQFRTAPDHAQMIKEFTKDDATGELTKPALETLSIIAYKGPISRFALEQIRGVNCRMILRNLMIRGLVESYDDSKMQQTMYKVTFEFLKFLGVSSIEELPDFKKLSQDEYVNHVTQEKGEE